VRSTLAYRQVNIVLMALVTLDCLTAEPRWPRGALTGLAAAIKLTPAAFVLFFLLRRDYRAAANGHRLAVAAAAGGLVLFAAAPPWWLGKFAGPARSWAPWQQAIGNSYVLFASLALFLAACGRLIPPASVVPYPGTAREMRLAASRS
jgi:uncharacterized membrane protein